MVEKVFVDEFNPELKLTAYVNDKNRVFIKVGDFSDDENWSCVTLDWYDLTELISELKFIKKQLESLEEDNNG